MDIYEKIAYTRSGKRPGATEYINALCDDFCELHGDRYFGDDPAVVAGVAFLDDSPVTVIGIDKGRTTEEKIARKFGHADPEGYRKALRLMKQAEKFHRPVLCLVDTAGANCGIGAEERGQGSAIAENLYEMMTMKTPIISVIIGEGGSGGALALAVADSVWMCENSYYSVVSPEGCASILWKDSSKAAAAAAALKPDAQSLKKLGVCDKIIDEPDDFSNEAARTEYFERLKTDISAEFKRLGAKSARKLNEDRYARFRKVGAYDGNRN